MAQSGDQVGVAEKGGARIVADVHGLGGSVVI